MLTPRLMIFSLGMLVSSAMTLRAQVARPSGVRFADAALVTAPPDTARARRAVILHDAAIGGGIGALTGALVVFIVNQQEPRVLNPSEDKVYYMMSMAAGAAVGLVIGAVVGAIRG